MKNVPYSTQYWFQSQNFTRDSKFKNWKFSPCQGPWLAHTKDPMTPTKPEGTKWFETIKWVG